MHHNFFDCRVLEDYAVVCYGPAIFKVMRLFFIALLCVHFSACIFYRVKRESAFNPEDTIAFYKSKYVDEEVELMTFLHFQRKRY